MSDVAIKVENLSKQYQLGLIGGKTLRDDVARWWARTRRKPDPLLKIGEADHGNRNGELLWALRDINFEVRQGEVVGIIGRNGAGKSTLLKILSRITAPTSGQVKVKGRIASLLEVGTGFHPELTGRENIYLNGSILGMRRIEIDRRLAEIVDFSGVEKFIDTPVKRYSSGMYVRLAFAVAAHLEPEILLVDEVLAVGDAEFQKKCLGKMGEVAREGRTVLFVSHNMGAIQSLCHYAILLSAGHVVCIDTVREVIDMYLSNIASNAGIPVHARIDRKGGGPARLIDVFVLDRSGKNVTEILVGDEMNFILRVQNPLGLITHMSTLITIYDQTGIAITHLNNQLTGEKITLSQGETEIICKLPSLPLRPGSYSINVALVQDEHYMDHVESVFRFSLLESDFYGTGKTVPTKAPPLLVHHSWSVKTEATTLGSVS